MGLIKAAITSAKSTLSDQYYDFFTADMKPRDLMRRIYRRTERGANTKSNEGVITNGSRIVVPAGVACIITDNGLVREFVAEAGEYVFQSGSESSFFDAQGLYGGLKRIFDKSVERIKMGGESGKDMRIYYVNTKEILDNLFGTPEPVPYEDPQYRAINLKYHGSYSFKIIDPIAFVENVVGTVAEVYTADEYSSRIKPEFMTKLNEVINKQNVPYNKLSSRGTEITEYMNDILDSAWTQNRGIVIVSVGINGITLDSKSQARVEKMSDAMFFSDKNAAGGLLASAGADAMVNAANNSGGVAMGVFGMNLAGQAMNNMGSFIQNMPEPSRTFKHVSNLWRCSCGETNSTKFCSSCGKPNPAQSGSWKCSCGNENSAMSKFCGECGSPKPSEPSLKCPACGFVSEKPVKFCPECGAAK